MVMGYIENGFFLSQFLEMEESTSTNMESAGGLTIQLRWLSTIVKCWINCLIIITVYY